MLEGSLSELPLSEELLSYYRNRIVAMEVKLLFIHENVMFEGRLCLILMTHCEHRQRGATSFRQSMIIANDALLCMLVNGR